MADRALQAVSQYLEKGGIIHSAEMVAAGQLLQRREYHMCQCGVPCCYCELEGLYSFWEGEEREKQSKGCEFWGKK